MSRFARHKDGNHKQVVDAFRACGASVEAIESGKAGCPDLLVGMFGVTELVEVKDGAAREKRQRELRDTQVAWHRSWRGKPVKVITSVDDALALVAVMRGAMTSNEVGR